MARKVIGPTGSRRRRWLFLLFAVAAVAAASIIPGALAVHDTGAFELDGNATNNPAVAGDDWDNVCHQVLGTDCSTTNNTTGATAVVLGRRAEPERHDLHRRRLQGPAGHQPVGVEGRAGGLPDKDNLLHSFAARYSLPPTRPARPARRRPASALLRLGPLRQQRRRAAGVLVLPEQDRARQHVRAEAAATFNGVHKTATCWSSATSATAARTSTIRSSSGTRRARADEPGRHCCDATCVAAARRANCAQRREPTTVLRHRQPDQRDHAPWPFIDKSGNTHVPATASSTRAASTCRARPRRRVLLERRRPRPAPRRRRPRR